jgi:GT2 family glycosyltransferase
MKLIAVLTTFNRREQTLACLGALQSNAAEAGMQLQAVVIDDASTDGTAQAVRDSFAWAQVVEGVGNLYWNRGMHQGMAIALQSSADQVLWLNDDTVLLPGALSRLLDQSAQLQQQLGRPVLVVGATADADGVVTYGGASARSPLRRFAYRRVWDVALPLPCEVVNGNCVLLPMTLARAVGNLDPAFEHAMGDTDYALRTRNLGHPIYAAAGVVGICSHNPVAGSFLDTGLSLKKRWRAMLSRKGLPWRSWLHFTRKHGGPAWPVYFLWPYARLIVSSVFRRSRPSS